MIDERLIVVRILRIISANETTAVTHILFMMTKYRSRKWQTNFELFGYFRVFVIPLGTFEYF